MYFTASSWLRHLSDALLHHKEHTIVIIEEQSTIVNKQCAGSRQGGQLLDYAVLWKIVLRYEKISFKTDL